MKTTRPYTMTARARSTEETRRRVLTATIDRNLELGRQIQDFYLQA